MYLLFSTYIGKTIIKYFDVLDNTISQGQLMASVGCFLVVQGVAVGLWFLVLSGWLLVVDNDT